MKALLLSLTFIFLSCFCYSQKQDRVWIFGDSTGIDFNNLTTPISIGSSEYNMLEPNASISDSTGQLLFYTNGIPKVGVNYDYYGSIYNKLHQLMDGGDSIYTNYTVTSGSIIFSFPNSNLYYIFHLFPTAFPKYSLYYSTVNMNMNGGLGKVTVKNILLYSDSLSEKITAIKHANGRDWWLICHQLQTNRFVKYLISPYSLSNPLYQDIGIVFPTENGEGEISCSQQGNKIAIVNNYGGLDLFSFDRCTGELSNYIELGSQPYSTNKIFYGLSFAPNGEVIYVSTFKKLFKLKLDTSDILSSKTQIASVSGQLQIGQQELASDGKIYITASDGGTPTTFNTNLSVINSPDDFANPNFTQYSFSLNGRRCFYGLPNMPNYNLGALTGSECDTITGVNIEQLIVNSKVQIYANPATNKLTIEYSIESKGELSIYNLLGEKEMEIELEKGASKKTISLQNISNGFYICVVRDDNGNLFGKKIVVQHE